VKRKVTVPYGYSEFLSAGSESGEDRVSRIYGLLYDQGSLANKIIRHELLVFYKIIDGEYLSGSYFPGQVGS
jgi:hypothetical protein